jgi:hypothetical protein
MSEDILQKSSSGFKSFATVKAFFKNFPEVPKTAKYQQTPYYSYWSGILTFNYLII